MKTLRALILILLFAATQNACAQEALPSAVRAFDNGTVQLLDGNFSAAISSYKEASETGWASPELYYNMGLAYHRMNKLGLAVVYLERAKRLAPEDPKILHSLSVASHKQVDQFSQLPVPFWKRIHAATTRMLPIGPAFWIGLGLWFVFVGLVVGKLLMGWRGDWWRRARIVIGAFAVTFICYSLASSAWPPRVEQGVVVVSELRLKEEPDEAATEVIRVHEGLVVTIATKTTDWTMIELPNGTRGWVTKQSIETI